MIDTVRYKIKVSNEFISRLRKSGTTYKKTDNETKVELYCVHNSFFNVGSYDYHVNLSVNEVSSYLYIEFSVPKFVYGHNLFTITLDNYFCAVYDLYADLLRNFGSLPNPESWEIQRLDLCYAWKFDQQATATSFLKALQAVNYPKLKKYQYDTSVMFKGKTITHKFYLKLPEFFLHDYKRLKLSDLDVADNLLNYANGILRFEITLRKKALQRLFETTKLRNHDLKSDIIIDILNMYFKDMTKFIDSTNYSFQDVKNKIEKFHSPKLARSLFLYYLALQHPETQGIDVFKEMTDRSTLYRYDTYLKRLAIPKFRSPSVEQYCFSIPSIFAVKSE